MMWQKPSFNWFIFSTCILAIGIGTFVPIPFLDWGWGTPIAVFRNLFWFAIGFVIAWRTAKKPRVIGDKPE